MFVFPLSVLLSRSYRGSTPPSYQEVLFCNYSKGIGDKQLMVFPSSFLLWMRLVFGDLFSVFLCAAQICLKSSPLEIWKTSKLCISLNWMNQWLLTWNRYHYCLVSPTTTFWSGEALKPPRSHSSLEDHWRKAWSTLNLLLPLAIRKPNPESSVLLNTPQLVFPMLEFSLEERTMGEQVCVLTDGGHVKGSLGWWF